MAELWLLPSSSSVFIIIILELVQESIQRYLCLLLAPSEAGKDICTFSEAGYPWCIHLLVYFLLNFIGS